MVVDVLRFSSTVIDATASGVTVALEEAQRWSRNGAAVVAAASTTRRCSWEASATRRLSRGRCRPSRNDGQARTSVAVIAAGELDSAGTLRFAVEDQLGAGAIVSALSARGIDHTAPDAAVAAEGFHALRGAVRHMVGASGSGRELADGVMATARIEASGLVPTSVADAAVLDAVDLVPVLRDGSFTRFE